VHTHTHTHTHKERERGSPVACQPAVMTSARLSRAVLPKPSSHASLYPVSRLTSHAPRLPGGGSYEGIEEPLVPPANMYLRLTEPVLPLWCHSVPELAAIYDSYAPVALRRGPLLMMSNDLLYMLGLPAPRSCAARAAALSSREDLLS
jgi:hypothetical protein